MNSEPQKEQGKQKDSCSGSRDGASQWVDPRDLNIKMKCADIQVLLLDYMNRELGEARSNLVREHLRKCATCQAAAAEIQATLNVLRSASELDKGMPDRLSLDRRQQIIDVLSRPRVDWIYIVVAIAITIIVTGAVISMFRAMSRARERDLSNAIVVDIGRNFDTNNTNRAVTGTNGFPIEEEIRQSPAVSNQPAKAAEQAGGK